MVGLSSLEAALVVSTIVVTSALEVAGCGTKIQTACRVNTHSALSNAD